MVKVRSWRGYVSVSDCVYERACVCGSGWRWCMVRVRVVTSKYVCVCGGGWRWCMVRVRVMVTVCVCVW